MNVPECGVSPSVVSERGGSLPDAPRSLVTGFPFAVSSGTIPLPGPHGILRITGMPHVRKGGKTYSLALPQTSGGALCCLFCRFNLDLTFPGCYI